MNQASSTNTWLALALGALTAYWGYLNYNPAVFSSRPLSERAQTTSLIGDQFVPARLWQDPLEHTLLDSTPQDSRTSPSHLRKQLAEKCGGAGPTTNAIILGVFVEGQAYPEDSEVRRRLRYAVQMSMHTMGYAPHDRNNLGVTILHWPFGSQLKETKGYLSLLDCGRPGLSLVSQAEITLSGYVPQESMDAILPFSPNVAPPLMILRSNAANVVEIGVKPGSPPLLKLPYEWFGSATAAAKPPVLVLWLAEEQFADYPLRRMGLLLDTIFVRESAKVGAVTLLGPRSSNTLKVMAQDVQFGQFLQNQLGAFASKLSIYSCQATVPDELLLNEINTPCLTTSFLRSQLTQTMAANLLGSPAATNILRNAIRLDDELVQMLVTELSNRGLHLKSRTPAKPAPHKAVDQIAVFFESDTVFGRSLALQFKAAVGSTLTNGNYADVLSGQISEPSKVPNLIEIPYLRGLDGTKPHEASGGVASNPSSDPLAVATIEQAAGDHQADYAKRLAAMLKKQDNVRRVSTEQGRIRAIGIFGSDVYDKLILLQVLRERFPNALFFTTDLDARLLQSQEQTWARNLIVASAFDLEPEAGSSIQFRDSYQTALYRACQAAVSNLPPVLPVPELFEVGRGGAIRLSASHAPPLKPGGLRVWSYSNQWKLGAGIVAMVSTCMLLLLLRNLAKSFYTQLGVESAEAAWAQPTIQTLRLGFTQESFEKSARDASARKAKAMFQVVFCGVIVLVLFSFYADWCSSRAGEEPFAWTLGISAWSTEWLRVLTAVFCISSIIWAYLTYKTRLHDTVVAAHMQMLPLDLSALPKSQGAGGRGFSGAIRRFVARHAAWSITRWPQPQGEIEAAELLVHYQRRGFLSARCIRVSLFVAAYLAFGVSVITLFGGFPLAPVRGALSLKTDFLVLFLSVMCLVALIAYVVDVTRLTERLIRALGANRIIWPLGLLNALSKETGLDGSLLSGYASVQFVATHTKHVYLAVYLPFVAISIMLISRSAFIDRWPWPPGLIVVALVNVFIATVCAWAIRRESKRVREAALAFLKNARATATPGIATRIKAAESRLLDTKIGAYSSWWHDPSVLGLLMPTGSAGAVSIIKSLLSG